MKAIITKPESMLEMQPAFSVPYTLRSHTTEAVGLVPEAMVQGISETELGDEFKFDNLLACQCTVEEMDKCFQAIAVSFSDGEF